MRSIRVAAITNSKLFLAHVQQLLATDPAFEFASAPSREQLRRPGRKAAAPDILLVDGRIARPLQLCSRVGRAGGPEVVLVAQEANELAEFRDLWKMAALDAGARGVLAREAMARDLLGFLRAVHDDPFWGLRATFAGAVDRRLSQVPQRIAG